MEIHLKISTLPKYLLSIIGLLLLLHCAQLVAYFVIADPEKFDFIELLDFDYEGNLPSFYSSIALLIASSLLGLIAYHKQTNKAVFRLHWLFLGLIFAGLTLDEALGLHEELGDFVESLNLFEAEGFLYFAWVVPYSLLLGIFLLSYFRFILSLPAPIRYQFIFAGLLFICGALGLEVFSAQEADQHGSSTIAYSVLYTLEELCEMLGIVVFIYALLGYIRHEIGLISIRLQ